MALRAYIFLSPLSRFSDAGLLLLRVVIGAFLIWGVSDNLLYQARMQEFIAFLDQFGFVYPQVMARVSVWVQLLVGLSLIVGFLTRWAGIFCAVNFIVAIVMVDSLGGIRASFPSACLVLLGIYLALHGAGRYSVDALLD